MRIFILLVLNLYILFAQAQVTFVIETLPSSTPTEDTIFISGTFNNWQTNGKNYILHQQLDGKYSITLPQSEGEIEYKFTRGSWSKVETDSEKKEIVNRIYSFGEKETLSIQIANWQDLGGEKAFNYTVFILFAIAIYATTLLLFASRIQPRNKILFKPFLFLNLILIISLIGAIAYNQSNIIWQSKINTFGFVLLFIWPPTFYMFLYSVKYKKKKSKILIHYLPSLVVFLWASLSLINFKPISFLSTEVLHIWLGDFIAILLGLAINLIYLLKARKLIEIKFLTKKKIEKDISLISLIYLISSLVLFFYFTSFISLLLGISWQMDKNFELIIVSLSSIIFVEFYYYWKYPQLLQCKKLLDEKQAKYGQNRLNLSIDKSKKIPNPPVKIITETTPLEKEIKTKLIEQMIIDKVYKDPSLNMSKLSEILEIKTHVLSKVLNEQFNKNFRDFINEYRIHEFVKLSISEKYKNFTFLALGYEVGFNSKSTFNLAFKKTTGFSPSEYLKKNYNIEKD